MEVVGAAIKTTVVNLAGDCGRKRSESQKKYAVQRSSPNVEPYNSEVLLPITVLETYPFFNTVRMLSTCLGLHKEYCLPSRACATATIH